ncbi:hypothetical protein WMY93_033731 [Mugilogobius chulae]|uniref:TLDc domain-containing protein n=1 Tax=Mugilogobius chulae TaxID=88201 RepID=A0AAW0MR27_9GOBI
MQELRPATTVMNSNLTKVQTSALCQELGGGVKLTLLFKASIHGFTGAAFHQRCDTRGPSVSVGYNRSGYVFGGYTTAPFCQSGQYVSDPKAFLFTFKGDKLLKYLPINNAYAVRMTPNSGPYFGKNLVLMNGDAAVTYSNPGSCYISLQKKCTK